MTQDPISLDELKSLTEDSSHSSNLVLSTVLHVDTRTIQLSIARNYESLEFSFRNLFRNSHRVFRNADVQKEFDDIANTHRSDVLNNMKNITQFLEPLYNDYEQELIEHAVVTAPFDGSRSIKLVIEVPEMHKLASLFGLADRVLVAAEYLWATGNMTIDATSLRSP